MTETDSAADTTLATVAGNLYGALMEARGYVVDASNASPRERAPGYIIGAASTLDNVDAALAEAADYLQGER